jgi:hypothetical protein
VSDTATAPAIMKDMAKLMGNRKSAARDSPVHRMVAINDDCGAKTVTSESGSARADFTKVLQSAPDIKPIQQIVQIE